MIGKVKFFKLEKGYGFLRTDAQKDIFFHVSDFENPNDFKKLKEGDELEFSFGESEKGQKAVNIRYADNQQES